MAETKVILRGDSAEAVSALNDAGAATDKLANSLTGVADKSTQVETASTKMAGSINKIQKSAKDATGAFSGTASSINSLAGVAQTASPMLGSLGGTVSTVASTMGSLTTVLNPTTLALGAVTAAAAYGIKKWQDYKAEVEGARAEQQRMKDGVYDLATALEVLGRAQGTAMTGVGALAGAYPEARAAVEAFREAAGKKLADSLVDTGKAMKDVSDISLGLGTAVLSTTLAIAEASKQYGEDSGVVRSLRKELENLQRAAVAINDTYTETGIAVNAVKEARKGEAAATEESTRATKRNVEQQQEAVKSARELADEVLKAAAASGDWTSVMTALAGSGEEAALLSSTFAQLNGEVLKGLGFSSEQIDQIYALNEARRSGLQILEDTVALERQRLADQAAEDKGDTKEASIAQEQHLLDVLEAQRVRAEELASELADVSAGFADLFGAMGEAAAGGNDLGDALADSAKKTVASIAKSYGQLYLAQGAGMVFVNPSQGAGLLAAGAALMALGGAVGGAGGASKGGSSGSASASTSTAQTTIVNTYGYENSGFGARDTGRQQDNADRYGIDRGREWA